MRCLLSGLGPENFRSESLCNHSMLRLSLQQDGKLSWLQALQAYVSRQCWCACSMGLCVVGFMSGSRADTYRACV